MSFSVLMSVYAKESSNFLDFSLDSIFSQTIIPDEVVLVQDGPLTIELYKVIDSWRSKLNIVDVVLPKNMGLGYALNEGLKFCNHDIVARMDSDDICTPNRFEKQIEIISTGKVHICGSYISEFDQDPAETYSVRKVPTEHHEIAKYARFKNPLNHPSVMFFRSKVLSVGSYDDVLYFEDFFLWHKLLNSGCVFYNIPESLVLMRAGASQLTRRRGYNYAKYELRFLKKCYSEGFITFYQFIFNLIFRIPPRFLPETLLFKIYQMNRK